MSWKIKARAVSHKINLSLATRCRGFAPMTCVFGYPKSGTTWACQLVADYIEKPFPRYNLFPTACPAVIHGHELPRQNLQDQAYVVRDGRDAMVSLYNHYLKNFPKDKALPRFLKRTLPEYHGPDKVAENLPGFIRAQARLHYAAPCNWSQHVVRAHEIMGEGGSVLKYEELVGDNAEAHLMNEMAKLPNQAADPERAKESIARYAFDKQKNKPTVGLKHFMNKGQAGNWRNYFTRETAQIFVDLMGEGLITAGYEKDNSWVDDVPETLEDAQA